MGRFDLSVFLILVVNCMPTILASNTANTIGGRLTTQAHIHITFGQSLYRLLCSFQLRLSDIIKESYKHL